jgi:hypothetical protein
LPIGAKERPGRGRREGFLAGVIEATVVVAAATADADVRLNARSLAV